MKNTLAICKSIPPEMVREYLCPVWELFLSDETPGNGDVRQLVVNGLGDIAAALGPDFVTGGGWGPLLKSLYETSKARPNAADATEGDELNMPSWRVRKHLVEHLADVSQNSNGAAGKDFALDIYKRALKDEAYAVRMSAATTTLENLCKSTSDVWGTKGVGEKVVPVLLEFAKQSKKASYLQRVTVAHALTTIAVAAPSLWTSNAALRTEFVAMLSDPVHNVRTAAARLIADNGKALSAGGAGDALKSKLTELQGKGGNSDETNAVLARALKALALTAL